MQSPIKLEYKLLGPDKLEEGRVLYKDIIYIYKMLVDEGFKKDDIEINFKTDCYVCSIKSSEISLEGKINKRINFMNRGPPPLNQFLMETVKGLEVNVHRDRNLFLQLLARKDENPASYEIIAYLDDLENTKLLEKINYEIKWGMIWNSRILKNLVGSTLNPVFKDY
jgi:hypothetical protein